MPKISINDRNRIIVLHEEGYSQVNIAKRVNCSRASVQKIVKKYNQTGDVVDKEKSGRPKMLSLRDEQFLKITALRNRNKVNVELVQDLKSHFLIKSGKSTVGSKVISFNRAQFYIQ